MVEALSLGDNTTITAEDLAAFDEDQDDGPDEGYTGELPDFSGDEQDEPAAPATTSKLPPPKPKGPLGRKKVPAGASLKKKLTSVVKPKPAAAPAAEPSTAVSKGIKLTGVQLDAVMAQLAAEQPDLEGKLTREDVQRLIDETGIDKKFLKGEKGLMGSGRKDIASV